MRQTGPEHGKCQVGFQLQERVYGLLRSSLVAKPGKSRGKHTQAGGERGFCARPLRARATAWANSPATKCASAAAADMYQALGSRGLRRSAFCSNSSARAGY